MMSKILFVALFAMIVTSVDINKCILLSEENNFGTNLKWLCCDGVQFLSEDGKITAKAGACENSQNKVKPSAGSMLMIASFAIVLQLQLSH